MAGITLCDAVSWQPAPSECEMRWTLDAALLFTAGSLGYCRGDAGFDDALCIVRGVRV